MQAAASAEDATPTKVKISEKSEDKNKKSREKFAERADSTRSSSSASTKKQKKNMESGLINFSYRLFSASLSNIAGNVVVSPWCIHLQLASALLGSNNETKKEILIGMCLEEFAFMQEAKIHQDLSKMYKKLKEKISSSAETVFVTNLYLNNQFQNKEEFTTTLEFLYKTKIESIDFASNLKKVVENICKSVNDSCDNRLGKVLNSSTLSVLSQAVFLSGFLFKGIWKNGYYFNPSYVLKEDFSSVSGRTVPVNMLVQTNKFPRGFSTIIPDVQILRAPFHRELEFIIFLPKNTFDSFTELDVFMQKEENVLNLIHESFSLKCLKTLFKLPCIRLSNLQSYNHILRSSVFNNLNNIFENGTPDFSKMIVSGNLSTSLMEHKSILHINELSMDKKSNSLEGKTFTKEEEFFVDRSFFYIIADADCLPIQMGRVIEI